MSHHHAQRPDTTVVSDVGGSRDIFVDVFTDFVAREGNINEVENSSI